MAEWSVTGGFQTAHGIAEALRSNACDAVTIARGLLANPNLPSALKDGWDGPLDPPCSYYNRCLGHVLEDPLGYYDESRFTNRGGRAAMLREVFASTGIFTCLRISRASLQANPSIF
jgi:tRNA-dihydrouridine synthase